MCYAMLDKFIFKEFATSPGSVTLRPARVGLQFNYLGTAGLLTDKLFNNFPRSPLVTRCFSYLSLIKILFIWSTLFLYLPGLSESYRLPSPTKFQF